MAATSGGLERVDAGLGRVGGGADRRARRPERRVLHRAVREGFASVGAEAEARCGLPRRIQAEVERYLGRASLARR